jgi:hypothetical protein
MENNKTMGVPYALRTSELRRTYANISFFGTVFLLSNQKMLQLLEELIPLALVSTN